MIKEIEDENYNNAINNGKDKNYDNDMGLSQHEVINDAERVIKEDADNTFSSEYIRKLEKVF